MITALLAAVGAFVMVGAGVFAMTAGIANLRTSEHDKQQNGGADLSWYVLAGLLGLLTGTAAAVATLFSLLG